MSRLAPTPGQTVGPFYGYALPYAGGEDLVPRSHPRGRPPARHGVRRRGRAGPGRPARDLAGRRRRGGVPLSRLAATGRLHLHRLGSCRGRRRRALLLHHGRSRADRAGQGSLRRDDSVRTRAAEPPASPASTCPATRLRSRPTRCSPRCPEDRRRTLVATADGDGFVFDLRPAGRGRDRVLQLPGPRMTDLLWPGRPPRRGRLLRRDVLASMVQVEAAWLAALVAAGVAPSDAGTTSAASSATRPEGVAAAAEAGGTPVIPMLTLLRERVATRNPADGTLAARRPHQPGRARHRSGAVLRGRRPCAHRTWTDSATPRGAGGRHRGTVTAGRTLTQHAVPVTFGLKVAPVAAGGTRCSRRPQAGLRCAAGPGRRRRRHPGGHDGAAPADRRGPSRRGGRGPCRRHRRTARPPRRGALAHRAHAPHPVRRRPGDGDGRLGHIAGDVLLLNRPEIAELAEPAVAGRGGSSTMPQKANPVLSVLVRRAALSAPPLAAQLHLAAGSAVDERPDGAWHAEWTALAASVPPDRGRGFADRRAARRSARRHRTDGGAGPVVRVGAPGRTAQRGRPVRRRRPRPRARLRPGALPRRRRPVRRRTGPPRAPSRRPS